MSGSRCVIVGAGPFHGFDKSRVSAAFVIACDGGYKHLAGLGLTPDLLVGDFDSLSASEILPQLTPHNVVILKKEKDDTDTLAAIKEGLSRGFSEFHIYGGMGGARVDHTAANLQCLAYLCKRGARGFLYGGDAVATAITGGRLKFGAPCAGTVSVFAHSGEAKGVWERGLKYRLDGVTLTDDVPLGVSNEFMGRESAVEVNDGTLTVFYPSSIPQPCFEKILKLPINQSL